MTLKVETESATAIGGFGLAEMFQKTIGAIYTQFTQTPLILPGSYQMHSLSQLIQSKSYTQK